jgi:capsular polysaccharide biosynthesis protein
MFRNHRIVFRPLGSVFRNSIFCKANSKVIYLPSNSHPNSNFMMFDSLAGVDAQCYYDPGTITVDSIGKDFLTSLRLSDPERTASDLLRLVQ